MTTDYSAWGSYRSTMHGAAAWDTTGDTGQNPHADGTLEHEDWWASLLEDPEGRDSSL